MKLLRISITLLALGAGVWATDRWLGRWLLDRSDMADLPLPPFGNLTPELRAVVLDQKAAWDRGAPPAPVGGFDAELGWTNHPGTSQRTGVVIGGFGARGERKYPAEPSADNLRLACFGTSFVFGSEVADDETWCAQLEGLDPRIEALNFGVGAYGTDQALLRMRRKGLYGAQVAVMGLCLENIGRNVNRNRTLYSPGEAPSVRCKPRFLLRNDQLELVPLPYANRGEIIDAALGGRLLEDLSEHEYWGGDVPAVPGSWIARAVAARPAHERRQVYRLWIKHEQEPYRVTLALLKAFREEALAAGAERALVIIFARRMDLASYQAYQQKYWAKLLQDLEAADIEYLDMATRLVEEPPGDVFRWVHHSPHGNLLVADEVLARLKAWKLLAGLR